MVSGDKELYLSIMIKNEFKIGSNHEVWLGLGTIDYCNFYNLWYYFTFLLLKLIVYMSNRVYINEF